MINTIIIITETFVDEEFLHVLDEDVTSINQRLTMNIKVYIQDKYGNITLVNILLDTRATETSVKDIKL